MRSVPVYVTHELRLDGNLIGHDLMNDIFDELTIPNHEHIAAKERNRWQWEKIPEFHEPFDLEGDELVLPRGYALQLKRRLREHGLRVDWIDRTRWSRGPEIGRDSFSYRTHQPEAVDSLRRHRQGIYKAPTGSGKTATVCGLLWELHPQRALILVDRINLVSQWANAISQHIGDGFKVGQIGEGKWSEGRITVATIQTLWAKRHELGQDWFESFDAMVLDECHHVTAETYYYLVSRFSARYLLGVSATPDKTGEFELAQAVLGPVVYEDDHTEMREQGILIRPEIRCLYTSFDFPYYGDHYADQYGECEKPGCRLQKPGHGHRNNYAQMLAALVIDENRNGLICEILKKEAEHTALVATDRTTHIDALLEVIKHDGWLDMDNVYVLTGGQKGVERDRILSKLIAQRGKGILLSTIANEAMDLPGIDRIVLGFPTKNAKKVEQILGRGARSFPGKKDCIAYDLIDDIGPFHQQAASRRRGCYERLDLPVTYGPLGAAGEKRKGLGRL